MTPMRQRLLLAAVSVCLLATVAPAAGLAQDSPVVARVNGEPITQIDLALAEGEIGTHLAQLPQKDRRRLLIDYVINSRLMAQAGDAAGLDETEIYRQRLAYYRHKVLKDLYLEHAVRARATEQRAREIYEEQAALFEPEIEVRASHILVPSEEAARDILQRLEQGEDFADLASSLSQDSGSAAKGGDLGYFTRDRMVEPFADAAFALEPGGLSQPVRTDFGWHVIRLDDKRKQPVPSFEEMKDTIMSAIVQQETGTTLRELRREAQIEVLEAASTQPQTAPGGAGTR